MEKTKAWQTWIPVWISIFLLAAGWACSIFYQAGRNAEALQNVTQAYKGFDARLDAVNLKVDGLGAKVDQLIGYQRGMQVRQTAADPPKKR